MGAFIDLAGKKFNRLTVISKGTKHGNEWYWNCICDCGNKCSVAGSSLRSNRTKSCGCWKKEADRMPKGNVINLVGQKFGHLTVIERDGSDARGEAKWICECDCSQKTQISVLGSNLRTGHTQSCGCERRSHGELAIIKLLSENNISYECEKSMFKYSNNTNAKFDFYVNNKYLIEYDGETHYKSTLHGWHTLEQLEQQQERDIIKNNWCKENNIPLIRIPYTHLDDLCIEDLLLETSKFII
jgi:hypothetical protein